MSRQLYTLPLPLPLHTMHRGLLISWPYGQVRIETCATVTPGWASAPCRHKTPSWGAIEQLYLPDSCYCQITSKYSLLMKRRDVTRNGFCMDYPIREIFFVCQSKLTPFDFPAVFLPDHEDYNDR